MPKVPKVTEQTVKQEPIRFGGFDANTSAEAFGGGQSLENVGRAASGLADMSQKIFLAEKEKADQVMVQDADNKAAMAQSDIEVEVSKMRGRNAGGSLEFATSKWKATTEELKKGLSDDDQRNALQSKLNARYVSLNEVVKKHTEQERFAYDKQTTDGAVAQASNRALRHFNNDRALENSLFVQAQARIQQAGRNGLTIQDESVKNQVQEEASKTIGQVYAQRLLNGDEKGAEALRTRYKSILVAEDLEAMNTTKTKVLKKVAEENKRAINDKLFNNGVELTNRVLKLEFSDLAELERLRVLGAAGDPRGISDTTHNVLKRYLTEPTVQAKLEERNELLYGIPENFFDIDSDKDSEVDGDIHYTRIALFRQAAFDAYQKGIITQNELAQKIEQTSSAFENGFKESSKKEFKNGQAVWTFYKNFLSKSYTYKDAEGNSARLNGEQFKAAAGYLGQRLMESMAEKPLSKDEEVSERAHQILKRWIVETHPEALSREDVPNALGGENQGIRTIYPGQSKAKVDRTISPPPAGVLPPKVNEARLQYTAQKYGITVEEVLRRMGQQKQNVDTESKKD